MKQASPAPWGIQSYADKFSRAIKHLAGRSPRNRPYIQAWLSLFVACAIPASGADFSATWNGSADNSWNNPDNWTPNTFYPNNGNGGFTFNVTIPGGTPTLTEDITIQKLLFESGTLSGPGALTLNAAFDWPLGGVLQSGGTITLNGGGTVSGGWTKDIRGRTIINQSSSAWNWEVAPGWGFRTGDGTYLDNYGVVNIQTDTFYDVASGESRIHNKPAGVINKTSTGEVGIGVEFQNHGEVVITDGTLGFWGDTEHNGVLRVESGATVAFGRGASGVSTHDWNSGATLTGGGSVVLGAFDATLNVNDSTGFAPKRLETYGTVNLKDEDDTTVVGDLILGAGTVQGSGDLRINGAFEWPTGGSLQPGGEIILAGGGTVSGGWLKDIQGRTIINGSGPVWNWEVAPGWGFRLEDTTIENHGTVRINTDMYCSGVGGGNLKIFNGSGGTFQKTSGTGEANIAVPFENGATVWVSSGTLAFTGGYEQASPGASLILEAAAVRSSSDLVIDNGFVTGSGTVNADLNIMDPATIAPGFHGEAGTLTVINNSLSVAGTLAVDIGGPLPEDCDRIAVPGHTLIVSGFLDVKLMNGYVPDPTNEFVVAWGTFFTGPFKRRSDNLPLISGDWLPTADGNGRFRVYYGANSTRGETNVLLTEFEAFCTDPTPTITITCPADQIVYTGDPSGTQVSFDSFDITANSSCGTPWVYTEPASGSHFSLGSHTVTAYAVLNNRTQECSFNVQVLLGTPTITDQPDSIELIVGAPAFFTVSATGPGTLTYQWYHDDTAVGTDSPTFTLSSAQPTDAGEYWVVVANSYGSATSSVATLTVVTVPQITDQPDAVHVSAGYPASFTASAIGPDLTYQWYHDGTPVGTDSATYAIAAAATTDAGKYKVKVANSYGEVTSSEANLSVVSGAMTNELVVHLKFDNTYDDSSGRGNHASTVGSPSFDDAGRIGAAFQFSRVGAYNYATLGEPDDLKFGETTDYTIAFWYKIHPDSFNDIAAHFIASTHWSEVYPGYGFYVQDSGRFNIYDVQELGGGWSFRSEHNIADGEWRHVVWSVQRGILATTIMDGKLVNSQKASLYSLDSPLPVNIGTHSSTSPEQDGTTGALIDDVGFWRRALTPEEAVAIFSAGYSGKTLAEAEVKPPYDGGGTVPIKFAEGKVTLVFEGTPGYLYDVQRKLTLLSPWVTLTTDSPLTPGPDGSMTFTDPSPPEGGAYYRIVPR